MRCPFVTANSCPRPCLSLRNVKPFIAPFYMRHGPCAYCRQSRFQHRSSLLWAVADLLWPTLFVIFLLSLTPPSTKVSAAFQPASCRTDLSSGNDRRNDAVAYCNLRNARFVKIRQAMRLRRASHVASKQKKKNQSHLLTFRDPRWQLRPSC
jgi:hypothetical protein